MQLGVIKKKLFTLLSLRHNADMRLELNATKIWPLCRSTKETLRTDIPSPRLHSFAVTKTEPEDNLTLSSRCAWLFIQTGVSLPVFPWMPAQRNTDDCSC